MTKSSPASTPEQVASPIAADLLLPAQRDGLLCDLYEPGHLIHYRHQADAGGSPGRRVQDALVHGTTVTLLLEDGGELVWRHHDPERLRTIAGLLPGRAVAHPEFHALHIGPYWFNCAPVEDRWQDCAQSRRTTKTSGAT